MRKRHVIFLFLLLLNSSISAQDLQQFGKGTPVQLSGTLSVQGGPYVYLGAGEPRNEPFWWQLNGSPTLTVYGWQFPFSFNYGSRNKGYAQPFNRYGVSPYYKWITFHLGYRSIRMNPFVMSGLQFLGGGVEMNPKGFRFAAFYGRFAKALAQDTLASITPEVTYKRMGYGMKVGVGNRRNFFDISAVRVFDDTMSIPKPTDSEGVRPQDNLALGLGGRLAISKQLYFQFDVAASLLNRDLSLAVIDTFKSLDIVPALFKPHFGAQLLKAGQASINYTKRSFSIKLQVKQVDPDYRSLATYYQQSDLRSITVEPTLRLAKGKLRLGGSIGRQQDNVLKRKAFTSVRTISSASLAWQPVKAYNLNVNYSNYGITQQAGLQALNDTFRIAQNNRSVGLSQSIFLNNKVRTYTITTNVTFQELQDLNVFGTYSSGENSVWFGSLNLNRIRLRDNLGLTGGVNLSQNIFQDGTSYLLVGPSIGVSKPFAGNKLQSAVNLAYNKGFQEGRSTGETVNMYSSISYQVQKQHQFSLTCNLLYNSTPFASSSSFTEIRFLAGYTYIFQTKTK